MEFKDKVRNRRLELNLTLKEVAAMVNVSEPTIQRYESGEIKNIRRDKIKLLADALQVSPGYIMGWEDIEQSQTDKSSTITDVKQAMEVILAQPGLMLNGEMLSDESKIALANAIQMGLAYAEQMQKKEKDNK